VAPSAGERVDFVSFLRNTGSPRDQVLGAGTYGYGKNSLYQLSRCHTIVCYTQTSRSKRPLPRLVGAAIGSPFTHKGKPYTGRHWWGERAPDRHVDPFERDSAHSLAVGLGFSRRAATDTGTSILIFDPDLGHRTPEQAANAVAESLAWYFWPKMLTSSGGQPGMKFRVQCEASDVPVPTPKDFPPLELFATAMKSAKARDGGARTIRCEKPMKDVGILGLAKGIRRKRLRLDTGDDEPLIPERCAHIALMRPAELVVKYLERPALASDMVEYAGVFICSEEVEPHFAAAEPPAHDDWVPAFLEGSGKRFVNVALRRVAEAADGYARPLESATGSEDQPSLAKIGDLLGGLVLGSDGGRPGPKPSQPPRKPKPKVTDRLEISDPEPFRFAMVKGVPCALFQIRATIPANESVRVEGKPLIVLEGGTTVPADRPDVRLVGWLDPSSGNVISTGSEVTLPAGAESVVIAAVRLASDCALSVAIEVRD
jgi:hypothetical protein